MEGFDEGVDGVGARFDGWSEGEGAEGFGCLGTDGGEFDLRMAREEFFEVDARVEVFDG